MLYRTSTEAHVDILDQQVVVGNPLYKIDTDDAASISAADTTTKISLQEKDHSHSSTDTHRRIPMIKFLGKRDHVKQRHTDTAVPVVRKQLSSLSVTAAAVAPPGQAPVKGGTGVSFTTLKDRGFYGRPKFSLKEIEAIESGGAV